MIQAIISWVFVYPLITLLIFLLDPLIGEWALPSRTLLLSTLMVGLMTYGPLSRLNTALSQAAQFINSR